MSEKVVIIGGGAAGPKTAAKLRRENPKVKIDLFTREEIISYSACGLPYFIEDVIKNPEMLIIRRPEDFESKNISIHLKKECLKVNTEEKTVLIRDLVSDNEYDVPYDVLVIATGAVPVIPDIENINLKNIFTLRTVEDGIKIKEKMLKSHRAVLLGGGYISVELAEALVANGVAVTIVEKNPQILKMFDEDFAQTIAEYMVNRNPGMLEIMLNENVVKFEGNDSGEVAKVITASGKILEADFVVLGTGVRPNTDFLKDSGIVFSVKNSIKVDKTMKTSHYGIYAAGDCSSDFNLVTNRDVWVPMGSTANKEGRCAAINIAGGNCLFDGIMSSTITKYFDYTISIIGISYKEALALGFQPEYAVVTKNDKAGYMPDSEKITLKLIADRNTHTLLGVQGIGEGDVNGRINAVIPAILSQTKLELFVNLDLPYAPPYSPAIDPVLNAAQIILKKIS